MRYEVIMEGAAMDIARRAQEASVQPSARSVRAMTHSPCSITVTC